MSETTSVTPARRRPFRVVVHLDEAEVALIERKMAEAGIRNREAYIRKMCLDGHVLKIDFTDVKRLIWLLSNATNNLNQLAKRANETHSIATRDIQAMRAELDVVWAEVKLAMRKLAKL